MLQNKIDLYKKVLTLFCYISLKVLVEHKDKWEILDMQLMQKQWEVHYFNKLIYSPFISLMPMHV